LKLIAIGFGLSLVLAGTIPMMPTTASAMVCARGVMRAGCAGPRGAVVVRRPVVRGPVVVAPVARHRCAFVNGVRVCR
jgi:hypothetical protein